VAAVHLVRLEVEALTGVAARPGRGENAVVPAEEVSRWDVRPSLERPGLAQRLRVLAPFSSFRLGGERARNIVVEDVVLAALLVAGIRPPICEELAGRGDHRRHEHEQRGGAARADERHREVLERMANDDEVAAIADRLDDSVGVLPPAGRVVLAREIDGNGFVAVLAQLG
jgi:hypothetical protein